MATGPEAIVVADRYELGPVVGRGGMGEVRRARDTRLSRDVAIKVLNRDEATPSETLTRFEYEARAAAAVAHPNIVAVYDYGDDGERLYLVMELLDGRTLHHEMADGPLPASRVVPIVLDVLAGLGAAHARGILHRDIKPGNVLFDARGRAKLGDFGVATSGTLDLTQTGMVLGTPAYLAPERVEGRRATAQSDLYAMGVLCYEALSGEKPFAGDSQLAMARAIERGVTVPLHEREPDVPQPLSDVVMRAMARDPEARYSAAAELAGALRDAMARAGIAGDDSTGGLGALGAPTEAVKRIDATSAMPLPVTTGADAVLPRTAPPPVRRSSRGWIWLVLALVAIAAVIGIVLYINASNNSTTIPNSPHLPPGQVKDAFDNLQRLLKP
jgi:serine/threonine protein kinase